MARTFISYTQEAFHAIRRTHTDSLTLYEIRRMKWGGGRERERERQRKKMELGGTYIQHTSYIHGDTRAHTHIRTHTRKLNAYIRKHTQTHTLMNP